VSKYSNGLERSNSWVAKVNGKRLNMGVKHVVCDYNDEEIGAYIATGYPFDKAGSYAMQHPIFQPVAAI